MGTKRPEPSKLLPFASSSSKFGNQLGDGMGPTRPNSKNTSKNSKQPILLKTMLSPVPCVVSQTLLLTLFKCFLQLRAILCSLCNTRCRIWQLCQNTTLLLQPAADLYALGADKTKLQNSILPKATIPGTS